MNTTCLGFPLLYLGRIYDSCHLTQGVCARRARWWWGSGLFLVNLKALHTQVGRSEKCKIGFFRPGEI